MRIPQNGYWLCSLQSEQAQASGEEHLSRLTGFHAAKKMLAL